MSIFSRIIAGEIPCTKVYEDDLCIAILDINPIQKGHTLIIPKQEIEWLWQLPPILLHHCMDVVQNIMKAMITQLGADYVKVLVVGEEVPHCHIHLIPIHTDPNKDHSKKKKIEYEAGEMNTIAQQIADGIS